MPARDAAPVVIVLLDAEGRVILDNQEYKTLAGELHGEVPAQVLRSLRDLEGYQVSM